DPGIESSSPSDPLAVGSAILFQAADGTHGAELWRSDGPASGTSMVADIDPGTGSSFPAGLVAVAGTALLAATDVTHGPGLWRSDGTAAGTSMVADVLAGPGGSFAGRFSGLVALGGVLYFDADDGAHGTELWRSDGTASGTRMVSDIDPG